MVKYILWACPGPTIYCRYCISDVSWIFSGPCSNRSTLPSYHQTNSASLKSPALHTCPDLTLHPKEVALLKHTPLQKANWIIFTWVFPKIGVPPKSSILIGFSIIFTIHFGGFPPYFWKHPHGKSTQLKQK